MLAVPSSIHVPATDDKGGCRIIGKWIGTLETWLGGSFFSYIMNGNVDIESFHAVILISAQHSSYLLQWLYSFIILTCNRKKKKKERLCLHSNNPIQCLFWQWAVSQARLANLKWGSCFYDLWAMAQAFSNWWWKAPLLDFLLPGCNDWQKHIS